MKALSLAAVAALACACASGNKTAQAPAPAPVPPGHTVASTDEGALPAQARALFENAKVRVSRLSIQAGRAVPLPSTPNTMLYSMKDCRLRLDSAAGRSYEVDAAKDHVVWSDVTQRQAEATAGDSCDLLVVEMKPGAASGAPPQQWYPPEPMGSGVQTGP